MESLTLRSPPNVTPTSTHSADLHKSKSSYNSAKRLSCPVNFFSSIENSSTETSSILLQIDDDEYAVLRSPGRNMEYSYEILSSDRKLVKKELSLNDDEFLNPPKTTRSLSFHCSEHLSPFKSNNDLNPAVYRHQRSCSGRFFHDTSIVLKKSTNESRTSSRSSSPQTNSESFTADTLKGPESPIRDRGLASIFEGNGLFIRRDHPIFSQKFSRKVFVGGLPRDISIDSIETQFSHFGSLFVDWPNRENETIPPNGFAFLHFETGNSVENLFHAVSSGKTRSKYTISSQTVKCKEVEVKFWRMSDCECINAERSLISSARTVFVGALPRITTASELSNFMERSFSGVLYTTIDVDLLYGYPKGAGRVTFLTQASYEKALDSHYIDMDIGYNGKKKKIEIKPFIINEQKCCDACNAYCGVQCTNAYCYRCSYSLCENCEHTSSCPVGGSHSFSSRASDPNGIYDS